MRLAIVAGLILQKQQDPSSTRWVSKILSLITLQALRGLQTINHPQWRYILSQSNTSVLLITFQEEFQLIRYFFYSQWPRPISKNWSLLAGTALRANSTIIARSSSTKSANRPSKSRIFATWTKQQQTLFPRSFSPIPRSTNYIFWNTFKNQCQTSDLK